MIPTRALSLALLALPGLATPSDQGAAPAAFELAPLTIGDASFARRTLANGLQAFAIDAPAEDPARVSVFVVVGVGSGVEGAHTSGLAHLVEHALFTGTQTTGTDVHERTLVGWGAESNAYTRDDFTVYYDHGFGVEHLETVLAMEADRMRNLTWERDAYLHERYRLDREERGAFTQGEGRAELVEAAVLGARPYAAGVRDAHGRTMGPRIELEVARAFYDRWYHPRRMAVVVAGRVDAAVALDAVEAAFGALPAGPPAPALAGGTGEARGGEARFASSLARTKVIAAWVGPELFEADRVALQLAAAVLRARHRGAEATVEASMGGRLHADLFQLGAAEDDEGAARTRVDALIDELRSAPPTADELAAARAELEDDFATIPVHGRPYFSLAATVGTYAVLGDASYPATWPERLAGVTPAAVEAAVGRWLTPEARTTVVFEADPEAAQTGDERSLPDDPDALAAFAQDAADTGELAAAIAAYEKLLTLNPGRMNAVIYGYYLGSLKREVGDLQGALAALDAALAIVDYPDVRDLADEIRAELDGAEPVVEPDGEPTGGDPVEASTDTPARVASHAVTLAGDLAPEGEEAPAFTAEAGQVMADLEAWRGLDFQTDLVVEFILAGDAPEAKLNGWYEPDTKRLVVIENDNAAMGRGTMLHEMFHALQDQSFDLLALDQRAFDGPTPEDSFRALRALVEGEAMFAVADLMDYDFEQHTALPATGELDEARYEKIFHYGAGLRFVRELHRLGGWELVNEAYANPPLATTQIMHPDRYLAGVRPLDLGHVEGPTCDCPQDFHAARVLGEYGLALFLARPEATRARSGAIAARLAGDLCHTVHDADGAEQFVWYLAFFDRTAADEFSALCSDTLGLEVWSLDDSGKRVGVRLASDPLPGRLGQE